MSILDSVLQKALRDRRMDRIELRERSDLQEGVLYCIYLHLGWCFDPGVHSANTERAAGILELLGHVIPCACSKCRSSGGAK